VLNYPSVFGIGPFNVYEFSPDKQWHMDEPSCIKFRIGKAPWGSFELELIEPLEEKSIHRGFLDTNGEGIQYLGFSVNEYEAVHDRFLEAGFKPAMKAETAAETYNCSVKACYFDYYIVADTKIIVDNNRSCII
jgi:hypothetical protein